MKILIGIVVGAAIVWLLMGGSGWKLVNTKADTPDLPVATTAPPVVPTQPPVTLGPIATSPPQTTQASWCPNPLVQNNGCPVTTTFQLSPGMCVDYDPGSSTIAGSHEDRGSGNGWRRSLITAQAAWQPTGQGAVATVYQDPSCPVRTA